MLWMRDGAFTSSIRSCHKITYETLAHLSLALFDLKTGIEPLFQRFLTDDKVCSQRRKFVYTAGTWRADIRR